MARRQTLAPICCRRYSRTRLVEHLGGVGSAGGGRRSKREGDRQGRALLAAKGAGCGRVAARSVADAGDASDELFRGGCRACRQTSPGQRFRAAKRMGRARGRSPRLSSAKSIWRICQRSRGATGSLLAERCTSSATHNLSGLAIRSAKFFIAAGIPQTGRSVSRRRT